MSANLLLVDDDDSNRITLSALLEDEGYTVETAANFAEAAGKIGRGAPGYDLVLLDQHLGDGIGTELVPSIRSHLPKAKVLLISGSIEAEHTLSGVLDGIVRKGSDFPDILEQIKGLLAR